MNTIVGDVAGEQRTIWIMGGMEWIIEEPGGEK